MRQGPMRSWCIPRKKDAGEIIGFMQRWDNRCPIVIVPTMYYATPGGCLPSGRYLPGDLGKPFGPVVDCGDAGHGGADRAERVAAGG